MPNHINKAQIIEILTKFKAFKEAKTPYLNSKVGQIKEIEVTNFDFDEIEEEYQYHLKITIADFKKSWVENDFHNLIEYLNYQSNRPKKDLVIRTKNGEYSSDYPLEWNNQENALTLKKDYFTFKTQITTRNKINFENFIAPMLFKQDINELLRIAFLTNIINIISQEALVSANVQDILLNIKQIENYDLQNITSQYQGNLDQFQKQAFAAVLSNNPLVVIKGPPGTGKSRLITSLLKDFVFNKQKPIIIASQTHAALDNIIENISTTSKKNDAYSGIIFKKSLGKGNNQEFSNWRKMLKRNIYQQLDFHSSKDSEVKKLLNTTHTLKHSLNRFIPSEISEIKFSAFFSTIASTSFEYFVKNNTKFKKAILIVDEVSKSSIIDVLRFAQYAEKVILVGDDKQLSPIPDQSAITKKFIETLSFEESKNFAYLFYDSIFEKIFDPKFKDALILKKCYRSTKEIVGLYNDLAYEGQIIAKGQETFFEFKDDTLIKDLQKIAHQKHNLIFLNHQMFSNQSNNIAETEILNKYLMWLSKQFVNHDDLSIMIVFAYRKAYLHFKNTFKETIKKVKKLFKKVDIGTVDMMQGQEAELVIFLSGYNKDSYQYYNSKKYNNYINILQSLQRAVVMLSRTKGKLIILGNKSLMEKIEFWNDTTKERIGKTWKATLSKFYQINIKHD